MGKSTGKIALGLGLLTGAITSILFAPDTGKNIRKKIAKGDTKGLLKDLEAMGDEMKGMVVDLSNQPSVKEALNKAKDKAADVADIKREELDTLLKNATDKAETFKKKVALFVKEQKAALDAELKLNGEAAPKKTPKKRRVAKKAAAKTVSKKKK